jgi:flagellar biogenesis protein FliO
MQVQLFIFLVSFGALGLCISVSADVTDPTPAKTMQSEAAKESALAVEQDKNPSMQKLALRKESVIPQKMLIRVLIAIVLGLMLVFGIVYLLKRYLVARDLLSTDEQRIQLLEVRRLTPRQTLFMIRVDDKTVVLAQSGERLVQLDPAKSFNRRDPVIDK